MPSPHDDRIADLAEQIKRRKADIAGRQRELVELVRLRKRLTSERARFNKQGES